MSDKNKTPNHEDLLLAELEAYRTGEENPSLSIGKSMNAPERQAIDDLNNISKLFSDARPHSDNTLNSVDDIVLGHIKDRSREIRRERKVVQLFPRWKQVAVAAMAVLVCSVSFNLLFKPNTSENNALDIDGNGMINIIDAYLMDRKLSSGATLPENLDLNTDGQINYADVKTIVDISVSLEESNA